MKYTVNPDGTISIDKSIETGNAQNTGLDKESIERMGTYDTHKLFK